MPRPDGDNDGIQATQELEEILDPKQEEEPDENAGGEEEPEPGEDEAGTGDDGEEDGDDDGVEEDRPLTEAGIRSIIAEALGSLGRPVETQTRGSFSAPDTSAIDAEITEARTRYQRFQQRMKQIEEDGRDPTAIEALALTEEREINRLQKEKNKKLQEFHAVQSQEQAFSNRDNAVNALYRYQPQVPANLRFAAERMAEEFIRGRGSDWQRVIAAVDDPNPERIIREIRAYGERAGLLSPMRNKVQAKPVGTRKVTMKSGPIKAGGGAGGSKPSAPRKPVRHTQEERKLLAISGGIDDEELRAYEAKGLKHPLLKEMNET